MLNGVGKPVFELAPAVAEERVFLRIAGNIGQLFLARVLVALHVQRADHLKAAGSPSLY